MISGLVPVVPVLIRSLKPWRPVEVTLNGPRDGSRMEERLKGYLHCGPAGAGHFVKMIHNGISMV